MAPTRRMASHLALVALMFAWGSPALAAEPEHGSVQEHVENAAEEGAHEASGGEHHDGDHHAAVRHAPEDEHWWIGKLIPDTTRNAIASAVGKQSLMGDTPDKLNIAHVLFGVLVFFIGIGMALAARKAVAAGNGGAVMPPKKVGAFAFFDIIMEAILGLLTSIMSRDRALRFLPLVTAAAIFILISNLLGLVPGFVPPTQSFNTTFALGLVAFIYYNFQGIRHVGLLKYLKHFMGPLLVLAPLMIVIELISHTVRPLSLGLRLMGNMFGDHQVLAIFMGFGLPLIPLPLMALGLMVCVVQTIVFTLLFCVYLSLATEDHDGHDETHGDELGHAHAH